MSACRATYPITSVHLGGAEYDFLTAYYYMGLVISYLEALEN
eukprot:COSAG01_NODE_4021_length_5428_cov_4.710077_2_plen_42_part_00